VIVDEADNGCEDPVFNMINMGSSGFEQSPFTSTICSKEMLGKDVKASRQSLRNPSQGSHDPRCWNPRRLLGVARSVVLGLAQGLRQSSPNADLERCAHEV
jgi:hypothetical protein